MFDFEFWCMQTVDNFKHIFYSKLVPIEFAEFLWLCVTSITVHYERNAPELFVLLIEQMLQRTEAPDSATFGLDEILQSLNCDYQTEYTG